MDLDHDGLITREELKITMRKIGLTLSDKDISEMMRAADLNGDGKVNLEEFERLWREQESP